MINRKQWAGQCSCNAPNHDCRCRTEQFARIPGAFHELHNGQIAIECNADQRKAINENGCSLGEWYKAAQNITQTLLRSKMESEK